MLCWPFWAYRQEFRKQKYKSAREAANFIYRVRATVRDSVSIVNQPQQLVYLDAVLFNKIVAGGNADRA